jgi:Ca-activated chloride channel family protein
MAVVLVASSCGGGDDGGQPMDQTEAEQRLEELVAEVPWQSAPVTRKANIPPPSKDLSDTLPEIAEFPVVVAASGGTNVVVAEIFASTEKSGEGTDGWMVEAAESFNRSGATLADGREAKILIRRIPSGTGYQFIAAGESLPAGFSPSNQLWVEMAQVHRPMTQIVGETVPNVAGIVMKVETAEQLRSQYSTLNASTLIQAVIAGEVVMGYTDPFASSTGLNFLLTVLDEFAQGDESRLTAADVASVFEEFQRQVPFVALTTLQIRESVEKRNGILDAFVMEYQTFSQTDSLQTGYEFIPFGVRHDNPLYAVDGALPEQVEALELFAQHITGTELLDKASDYGFDPPAYSSDVGIPSGEILIAAQQLWKDKKDGGRPVYAVFVTDVSGSMDGSRLLAVQSALNSSREFISEDASVGMVEFNDTVRTRLDIGSFDLNQQALFAAAAEDMVAAGGTAMYDGVVIGLDMLVRQRTVDPNGKYLLIVLTDGETMDGLSFNDVADVVEGVRIPVYTVGFEADLGELVRLSALVEAASINANEDNVEFKMASLFNAGV